ncbi:MAG: sulfur carrier protein ThiS [Rickettsiales bacterium]|nr:sulfur carrier protein ThiS [Pseudomonadota bacterium]MDA0965850.1 sulfur carrier protein ThiS [Pseudomonadota bacterium]MDG4542680.1 sulfur carrier protein ThiS [Rickettsiales bacterium]MDG4545184.1 sulfur carrier protein ThiS [Rickettsiales bacterium]MDG4547307.1 sulfur carrier protein ThiS [Rickettsiales bacterium]
MKIILNGKEAFLDENLSVNSLIANLDLDPRIVAIEKNREIIPASEYDNSVICDGDKIEIVQFVGGG